jgi:hypothetical protein
MLLGSRSERIVEREVGTHGAARLPDHKTAAGEVAVVETATRLILGHALPQARIQIDRQTFERVVAGVVERRVAHLQIALSQSAGDLLRVARWGHQTGDGLQAHLTTFHDGGRDGRDRDDQHPGNRLVAHDGGIQETHLPDRKAVARTATRVLASRIPG